MDKKKEETEGEDVYIRLRTRHGGSPAVGKGTSRHRRGPAASGRTRSRVKILPLEFGGLLSDDFLSLRRRKVKGVS